MGEHVKNLKTQKMAKSLRSKWKRKMRAEKRVRYGEREDKRLVKMLEAAEELKKQDGQDQVMQQQEKSEQNEEIIPIDGTMDTSTEKSKFSSKSLKNEDGNYPKWMSKRKIQ